MISQQLFDPWIDIIFSLGFHFSGTKNLCQKFQSHDLEQWRRASKLDILMLNSEDASEVQTAKATQICTTKGVSSSIYEKENSVIEKLPCCLSLLNDKDARKSHH